MAKDITIAEGGVAKSFTQVDKIQTRLSSESGEGTVNWVPQDEAINYVDLTQLNAKENGVYYAEGSNAAFDVVTVDVPEGEIPHGDIVEAIAAEDFDLYDTVKVVSESDELTKLTDDAERGFLPKGKKYVYRLFNNRYNRYNILTGRMTQRGKVKVYEANILNGGVCSCLRLSNNTDGTENTAHTGKYRFMWYDGTICTIKVDFYLNHYTKSYFGNQGVLIGVSKKYIAIYRGRENSDLRGNYYITIYDKTGKVVNKEMAVNSWIGENLRPRSIYPMSKNKVAGVWSRWYSNTWWGCSMYAASDDFHVGSRDLGSMVGTAADRVGYYGDYCYCWEKDDGSRNLMRFKLGTVDEAEAVGAYSGQIGPMDQFGRIQLYTTIDGTAKYRLYQVSGAEVENVELVYGEIIAMNNRQNEFAENDLYVITNKTYRKGGWRYARKTDTYPRETVSSVKLGIVREAVDAGAIANVIILFE